MTLHAKPRADRVRPEDLNEAILDTLKVQPRTVAELAKITGYVVATIRLRMAVLEDCGEAYQVTRKAPHGCGREFVWHAGYAPTMDPAPPAEVVEKPIPGELPRRFFPKEYPRINRRDPLVVAIHGMGPAPSLMLEMER